MLNVGDNKHILPLSVAPDFSAEIPEKAKIMILFCIRIGCVTYDHVWTTWTFFVIQHVIWVVSYVDIHILQKLIRV